MSVFLETSALPHFWCEGCGNGIVLGAIVRALDASGIERDKTVVVTGIGCTGKLDDYVSCHTVHTTHGRALAAATGIKAANPELTVIAVLGDGDGATIGGNHLLHSARRNIGVTAILINNMNYGMTGGQYSGTTPLGSRTATSPYGDPEPAMDLCRVVEAAGAGYVARSTVYHVAQLERFIRDALGKPGFSFVEAVSTCPTYFGRLNGTPNASQMLHLLRDQAIPITSSEESGPPGLSGKFKTGVFADRGLPGFSERYRTVQDNAVARSRQAGKEDEPQATPPAPGHWEIVMAGSGGQGLGLAGLLIGQAAVEYGGMKSSQTQAYGTAARGGFAKSELIISSDEIDFPGVTEPNIVIALSQEAYERYSGKVPADCRVIYDSGEVTPVPGRALEAGYPMARTAIDIGEPQSANLVSMGVLLGVTGVMDPTAVLQVIRRRFPGRPGPVLAFQQGLKITEACEC